MVRSFSDAIMKVLGAGEHLLTVLEITDITPHYRRIKLHSDTLFEQPFETAAYLRLWIPALGDSKKEFQRGYTVIEPDYQAKTLFLEFVIHQPTGPAAGWAKRAQPGDQITATRFGANKFEVPDPVPAGFILLADIAGLPAVNSVIQALPAETKVLVVMEHTNQDDTDIPIIQHPNLRMVWLPENGEPDNLANQIVAEDWTDWYAWGTAESGALKKVRDRLKELGFPKQFVHAQAYWIRGRAMGVDRELVAEQQAEGRIKAATHSPRSLAAPALSASDSLSNSAETAEQINKPALKSGWRISAGSKLLSPLKWKLIVAGVAQAIISILELLPYFLLAELGSLLLVGSVEVSRLWQLGLWAVIVFGVGTTLSVFLVFAMHLLDADFGLQLRKQLINKLNRLPLGWFTSKSSGRVKQAVIEDSASLHYLVTHAVLDVVGIVVTPLVVIIYLFAVDARIAGVLLIPLVTYGILMGRMVQRSGTKIAENLKWNARAESESIAYLDGLPVVRSYPQGKNGQFRNTLKASVRFLENWQVPFLGSKAVNELVSSPLTSLWIVILMGVWLVSTGSMTPASLVPFLLLGPTFSSRLLAILLGFVGIQEGRTAAKNIGVLLTEAELQLAQTSPDVENATQMSAQVTANQVDAKVKFDRVSFGYEQNRKVINQVSLDLPAGTVTALVGPSGSGKSTMAALLARFYDVDSGSIRLDGVDIRTLTQQELYKRVGFVLQQVSILADTVADNIAIARPDASRAEIEAAAMKAQIHDRILRLPNGYDTVLDANNQLSGGEAQRISVARVLLADPELIILDEATAFADPESEYEVQLALSNLVQGRTSLVIAHRLHTIQDADQIAVMQAGALVQLGTHADLVVESGLYKTLWQARLNSWVGK